MERPLLSIIPTPPYKRKQSTFCTQFRILVWKNWLVSIRNYRGTIGILLTPILVCVILSSFQCMSNVVLSHDQPHPPSLPVAPLPQCTVGLGGTCTTIVYTPSVPWTDEVMQTLCKQSQGTLIFGQDVIPLPQGSSHLNNTWCVGDINHTVPENQYIAPWFHIPTEAYIAKQLKRGKLTYPCEWYQDNQILQEYLLARPNQTQAALQFTSAYIDASLPTSIPGLPSIHLPTGYNISVGYSLYFNATINKFPIREPNNALETMRALDTAILSRRTNDPNASITANYARFPVPKPRLVGYDVVSSQGGIWFFLPGCVIFFSLFVELVTEKELQLKLGMQFMGMTEGAYWSSWVVSAFIFSTASTAILIASGHLFGYSTFINTDLAVLFVIYWCFNIAMCGLSFFLASIVNTRKGAQTIGYSFILVGFVFQTIICTGYGSLIDLLFSNDVAWWVNLIRYVLQCYPPFSFAKAFFAVSDIAGKQYEYSEGTVNPGHHFYWHNGTQTRHKRLLGHDVVVPPMFDSINLMLLDMVGYFLIAWYLDNVMKSDNTGSSKPLWFCCLRSFWWRNTATDININTNTNTNDNNVEQKPALIVDRLVKEYGGGVGCCSRETVRAVDGLTLTQPINSILALLGHNGAGKSTTIGILTGLLPLSSGTCSLFGKNVSDAREMSTIQSLSGVCPQHDILFPELTANEHCILFAHIKGVPVNEINKECEERLKFMDLLDVRHHRSSTFSGGMKRRLSVAMATISDPPFLVLDEPTTGMDPVNRRMCWKLIQKLKQDRLIIVTTHSMLEAETLGDSIGIMAKGKLAAKGTPLQIKNEYGDGYSLSIVLKDDSCSGEQALTDGFRKALGSASRASDAPLAADFRITQRDGRALKFCVPSRCVSKLPLVLRYLESVEGEIVSEWGVSDSTLESAFLNVTERSGFSYSTNQREEEINIDSIEETKSTEDGGVIPSISVSRSRSLFCQSFCALLHKNFLLQSRQRCSSFCQVLTPILVMLLLTLLQAIIRTQIPPSGTVTIPSIPYPLNAPTLASVLTHGDQAEARGGRCLEFFDFSVVRDVTSVDVEELTDLVGQRNCSLASPWEKKIQVPYFTEKNNWTRIQEQLFQDLTILNSEPKSILENIDLAYPNYLTPDGAVEFATIDSVQHKLNFTFSVNDAQIALFHRPNGFTRLASKHASLYTDSVQLFDQGKMALFSMLSSAFIDLSTIAGQNGTTTLVNGTTTPVNPAEVELLKAMDSITGIKMVASMPLRETPDLLGVVEVFGSFLYPMALTLQLPVYIFIIVLEKETRLRELQKTMGMKMSTYWLSSMTFNMILYVVVAAFFWIVGAAVNLRFFTQTGTDLMLVFFLLWGLSLNSMALLISSVISSRRVATVVGYIIVLFGNGIALVLSDGIYGDLPDLSVSSRMPSWLLLNPQFAMVRLIYKANFSCAALLNCYGSLSSLSVGDEISECLFYLLFDAIWILLLALYLDQVVPSQWGVSKHPCFCCTLCEKRNNNTNNNTNNDDSSRLSIVEDQTKNEDQDVTAERNLVHDDIGSSTESAFLVRTQNLRKEFSLDGEKGKSKVAVHSLSIGIKGGTLFGLLGENGAGKTTTINMLVGTLMQSSGVASVAGHDISKNIDLVHRKTGIVPQHDVLWPTLSVEEHLRFYSQMKGIDANFVEQHVARSLSEVGLLHCRRRYSSQLSGGMKRRLSIAIAMVGNSEIVFLDEPTTGLDPASRRAIWRIIENAKRVKSRAMIMTTHLMDEAEHLCTRIGIMTEGRLRCVAGQQRLKSLYGGGYKVTLNYSEDVFDRVRELIVTRATNGATLIHRFVGQSTWRLPASSKVSSVFEILHERASKHGVTDWALGQTSLDDVFAFIVAKYK